MQVITEDRDLNLNKVKVEMLGTAKKVCAHAYALPEPLLYTTDFLHNRSLFLLMTQLFYMVVGIRS